MWLRNGLIPLYLGAQIINRVNPIFGRLAMNAKLGCKVLATPSVHLGPPEREELVWPATVTMG